MKIRDLSFLAVRILSIYLFVLGLNHLINLLDFTIPTYLQVIEHDMSYAEVFLVIGIPTLILLIGSIALWFLADKLSRIIIPANAVGAATVNESEGTVQTKEIEGFVLSVIGLILLILSFTSLIRMIIYYFTMTNQEIFFNNKGYIYSLIEQLIRFLIGIILLFKAQGFVILLRKLRNVGRKNR